ncbi:MAG TPA: hypothetical protein VGP72_16485 [Planctomycetota bacterium]|jgi:hypothetical protein
MGNSVTVANTNSPFDGLGRALIAKFQSASSGYGLPGYYCSAVVQSTGTNPSYALVGIPIKSAAWDQEPGVALSTAVAGNIKLLARASAGYYEGGSYVCLMNGWVMSHGHNLYEDSIVTCVMDDRAIWAQYFTVMGRLSYNVENGVEYYNSNPNDPLVLNDFGHGNCILHNGRPRFVLGYRYGSGTGGGDSDPGTDEAPTESSAGKWSVKWALKLLRDMFYNTAARPWIDPKFGLLDIPKAGILWDDNIGDVIKEDRTFHSFSLEGKNLLQALQQVVQYAGPYEVVLMPIGEFRSKLLIVDVSTRANTGTKIYHPKYFGGLAEVGDSPVVAVDAHIKQSVLGYAYNAALTGDSHCIEYTAQTSGATTYAHNPHLNDAEDCLPQSLSFGWTAGEQAKFLARVAQGTSLGGGAFHGNAESFDFACRKVPNCFAWYKLNSATNPFTNCKWSAKPEAAGAWRIKPHLISCYNDNVQSPAGIVPREHVIEYRLTQYEWDKIWTAKTAQDINDAYYGNTPTPGYDTDFNKGEWRQAKRYSGLTLTPDGRYVKIEGSRDGLSPYMEGAGAAAGSGGYTWGSNPPHKISWSNSTPSIPYVEITRKYNGYDDYYPPYDSRDIVPRDLRITLVAESNNCLVQLEEGDPNNAMQHIDAAAPHFTFLQRSRPMQYVDWLRRNQDYPQGIGGYERREQDSLRLQFQPKQSANNELYTNVADGNIANPKNVLGRSAKRYLDNHKRIQWEGHFVIGRLTPCYVPGQYVEYEGPDRLAGAGGIIKCLVWSASKQTTSIEIGPPAFSSLWDGPLAVQSSSNSGSVPDSPASATTGSGSGKGGGPNSPQSGQQQPTTGYQQPNTGSPGSSGNSGQTGGVGDMVPPPVSGDETTNREHAEWLRKQQTGGGQSEQPKQAEQAAKGQEKRPLTAKEEHRLQKAQDAAAKAQAKNTQLNENHGGMTSSTGQKIKAGELGSLTSGWKDLMDHEQKKMGGAVAGYQKMFDSAIKDNAVSRAWKARTGGGDPRGGTGMFDTKAADKWANENERKLTEEANRPKLDPTKDMWTRDASGNVIRNPGYKGTTPMAAKAWNDKQAAYQESRRKLDDSRNMWTRDASGKVMRNPNYAGMSLYPGQAQAGANEPMGKDPTRFARDNSASAAKKSVKPPEPQEE